MHRTENDGSRAAERQRRYRFRKREFSSRVCLLCGRNNMWEHRHGCNDSVTARSRRSPPTQSDVTELSTSVGPTLSTADQASEYTNPTTRSVIPRIFSPANLNCDHRSSSISPPPLRTVRQTYDSNMSNVPDPSVKKILRILVAVQSEMRDERVRAEAFRKEMSDRLEKMEVRLDFIVQCLIPGASKQQVRKYNLEKFNIMTKMEDLDAFLVRLSDAEFREHLVISLSRLSCSDPRLAVRNMLRVLFAPEFASQLTWLKGEDKRPISCTELPRLIKDAIYSVATHSSVTADSIEKSIQSWFKGAFDRIPGNRKLRRERAALRRIDKIL